MLNAENLENTEKQKQKKVQLLKVTKHKCTFF